MEFIMISFLINQDNCAYVSGKQVQRNLMLFA